MHNKQDNRVPRMTKRNAEKIVDELSLYPYDPEKCTETIEIELDDKTSDRLALMAFARGISINHLICAIIHREIELIEAGFLRGGRRR